MRTLLGAILALLVSTSLAVAQDQHKHQHHLHSKNKQGWLPHACFPITEYTNKSGIAGTQAKGQEQRKQRQQNCYRKRGGQYPLRN